MAETPLIPHRQRQFYFKKEDVHLSLLNVPDLSPEERLKAAEKLQNDKKPLTHHEISKALAPFGKNFIPILSKVLSNPHMRTVLAYCRR